MKIVYFGSDVFLPCFEYFLKYQEILALYTYHNDEDYFIEYSIVKRAKECGIPVHYEAVSPEDTVKYFNDMDCGLFFVAEYNRIIEIPENLPNFRGINIHSSLLPEGRSYYPIEAAMERGLRVSGVTMHKLAKKLDQGDIIMQKKIEIDGDTDSVDVYLKCSENALDMVKTVFSDFSGYWSSAAPQPERLPYWKRPDECLMSLSHDLSKAEALEIFRKYNGMTQVKIDNVIYYVNGMNTGSAELGSDIRKLSDDRALYRVKDGHLRLHIIPREGAK